MYHILVPLAWLDTWLFTTTTGNQKNTYAPPLSPPPPTHKNIHLHLLQPQMEGLETYTSIGTRRLQPRSKSPNPILLSPTASSTKQVALPKLLEHLKNIHRWWWPVSWCRFAKLLTLQLLLLQFSLPHYATVWHANFSMLLDHVFARVYITKTNDPECSIMLAWIYLAEAVEDTN